MFPYGHRAKLVNDFFCFRSCLLWLLKEIKCPFCRQCFLNILLCKERKVIVKNSTLTFWDIYMLWALMNSFMLFLRWCIVCMCHVLYCMCVSYVCVCMYMQNTLAFKECFLLSSNLVCILQVTVGRTLLILVNIG